MLGILISLGMASICSACDGQLRHSTHVAKEFDSLAFSNMLIKCLPNVQSESPKFEDITSVIIYKQKAERVHQLDSIFFSLTDQQVSNIASVLIRSNRSTTVQSIVLEYLENKYIYDNLPKDVYSAYKPRADDESVSTTDTVKKVINIKSDSICVQL